MGWIAGDLGKEQLLVFLRSHQLSVGSHPTPTDLLLPKKGKPTVLVYGNDKTKAKALPWIASVAGLRGRAFLRK